MSERSRGAWSPHRDRRGPPASAASTEHWQATKDVVRRCNEMAGPSGGSPDLVVFAGWEWTQIGKTPERHWGHKNVIFPGTADDELPARPISARARDGDLGIFENFRLGTRARFVDPLNWGTYQDLAWLLDRVAEIPMCPRDVDTRALPADCHESAETPAELYARLDQWGFPALVIPHGNAWGVYTPPATSWDKSLTRAQLDPERQRLLEVMSGHGNSEEYRGWRAVAAGPGEGPVCPEPSDDFLPCCWQAGEIMRARCGDLPAEECERRVALARRYAAEGGVVPFEVFPDAAKEEWLDCDQCRDCFKPGFNHRPGGSSQYALAISNFDEPDEHGRPLRFRYGFIASTDDHTARPGTGYKQYQRRMMTIATGVRSSFLHRTPPPPDDPRMPQRVDLSGLVTPEGERLASFAYPGGIVAVHADGRSREAIWEALMRRETYGTSGPRMLLYFDLLSAEHGRVPMGSEVTLAERPRFEVRAAGALRQQPGCGASSTQALSADRLAALCAGECHNPGDERHGIEAIEVVRIRPQQTPDEDVDSLIEDPWLRFECDGDPGGCVVQFEDPEHPAAGRETIYYVRAIQAQTPAINGGGLRTTFDDAGRATSIDPCWGDYRTDFDDDCLAPASERAWSSPIFLRPAPPDEA